MQSGLSIGLMPEARVEFLLILSQRIFSITAGEMLFLSRITITSDPGGDPHLL